jgi:hypothetical protein
MQALTILRFYNSGIRAGIQSTGLAVTQPTTQELGRRMKTKLIE